MALKYEDEMLLWFMPLVEMPCTFCNARMSLGRLSTLTEGEEDVSDIVVLHTGKKCQEFVELDLLDFMQQNRRRLGISDELFNELVPEAEA